MKIGVTWLLMNQANQICNDELARTLNRLDSLSSKDKKAIEKMAAAVTAKLLHHPLQYLKSDHHCVDQRERVGVVRSLFNLDTIQDGE